MDRRTFCTSLGAVWALWGCGGAKPRSSKPESRSGFLHGIASGDPLADRVILWTRITDSGTSRRVGWTIARDPGMRDVVALGDVVAVAARDYTVKVDVSGLEPGTTYYYQFKAKGHVSAVGRTRTLPVGRTDHLRLAFASCSSVPWGFFNAYATLARRKDLDAILHLGDYIYEHANGTYGDGSDIGRIPVPNRELLSLQDYRRRHAQYKADPDSQAMHRQHPLITIWDDHELANDAWKHGAENHNDGEGDWMTRREAAVRAYFEWMPIREQSDALTAKIYRSFRFGDLAHLNMLDTRLIGRDVQLPAGNPGLSAQTRSLLGDEQERWLHRELSAAKSDGVAWNLLGQQVLMAPVRRADGSAMSLEKWDGYPAARNRLFDHLERESIRDVVVMTGDFHASWALDVPRDPFGTGYDAKTGRGALAVEFVTPGISAPGSQDVDKARATSLELAEHNPHLRWTEFLSQGYALLDVTRERVQCDWYFIADVRKRQAVERFARGYFTERGQSFLQPAGAPAPERAGAARLVAR